MRPGTRRPRATGSGRSLAFIVRPRLGRTSLYGVPGYRLTETCKAFIVAGDATALEAAGIGALQPVLTLRGQLPRDRGNLPRRLTIRREPSTERPAQPAHR